MCLIPRSAALGLRPFNPCLHIIKMQIGKRLAIIRFDSRNGIGITFFTKQLIQMLHQIIAAAFFKLSWEFFAPVPHEFV